MQPCLHSTRAAARRRPFRWEQAKAHFCRVSRKSIFQDSCCGRSITLWQSPKLDCCGRRQAAAVPQTFHSAAMSTARGRLLQPDLKDQLAVPVRHSLPNKIFRCLTNHNLPVGQRQREKAGRSSWSQTGVCRRCVRARWKNWTENFFANPSRELPFVLWTLNGPTCSERSVGVTQAYPKKKEKRKKKGRISGVSSSCFSLMRFQPPSRSGFSDFSVCEPIRHHSTFVPYSFQSNDTQALHTSVTTKESWASHRHIREQPSIVPPKVFTA